VSNIENVYKDKYLAKQEYLKYTNIYVQYNGIVYNEYNGTRMMYNMSSEQ